MTLKTGLATALVAAVVAALVTAATLGVVWRAAPGVVDAPGGALEEKRVIEIVRNYLTDNPEILVEMTTELDKRQAEEQAAQQSKTISDNKDALFRSKLSFTGGNPDGDVTLVEFFDYNCGYCKRALPDIVKLVDEDFKVRLVLKELPIFGEDSEAAAKGALAAMKQNKYFEMHQKLYSESGKADKEKVLKVAGELGLDVDQLQEGHGERRREEGDRRGARPCPEARASGHPPLPHRRQGHSGRARRPARPAQGEGGRGPGEGLRRLLGRPSRLTRLAAQASRAGVCHILPNGGKADKGARFAARALYL